MPKLTLQKNTWYACEIIGDEFKSETDLCSYSPIKILSLTPLKTGQRIYRLQFYHANYPQGVQIKDYPLQTIERGKQYLLAQSIKSAPIRYVQIYPITAEWLSNHFQLVPDQSDLQSWLNRHFNQTF